jgi:hypothetical protein
MEENPYQPPENAATAHSPGSSPFSRLAMPLYIVLAIAIYLSVDVATAFTKFNDLVGGLVLKMLILFGIGLALFRRRNRRR